MTTTTPPPPTLSPGSRGALRVVLVIVAAAAVVSTVVALAVAAFALSTFRVVTDTQALPPTARSLTLDTGNVPVAVHVTTDDDATQPRVDLKMVSASDRQRLALATDATGSRVTLDGSVPPYLSWARGGEVTVVLPDDQARGLSLTVRQGIGFLSTDAELDQLIVRTTNGAVRLGGSARRVEVHVRNGDLGTRSPIGVTESFTADLESGDASLAFRAVPHTIDAVTKDGDIEVALPDPGPYRVRAESEGRHGDTTVSVPETSDPRAPQVTVRSDDGDVKVTRLR